MKYLTIQQAMEQGSGEVNLRGWVYRERGSAKFKFIVLRDHTNIIQCVIKNEVVGEKKFKLADTIQIETSMMVHGEIKKDPRAPTGYEAQVKDFQVVGGSDTYPITKDQSYEFLLDKRHLWIRSRKLTAIMKIRSTVFGAIHHFFRNKGFYEWPPPIFTPTACEGGNTLFEVKFFNDKVYLTQSWQLYAEAAICALENVYCISPCFRAEPHKTARHLAEFWMAETEMAWLQLQECIELAKELVAFVVQEVIKKNTPELTLLGQDIEKLKKITLPFQQITYTEALEILKKDGIEIPWGKDLRTTEEDALMKHFDKPLVVTHYPKEIMAFYKPADPKNSKVALCFDMLAPEGYGEIIGGSERDTNIEVLKENLKKQGENVENYEWYLDLRRYGAVPHSGFGMGVERVVAWLCKLDNIKDAIPFPRTMLRKLP